MLGIPSKLNKIAGSEGELCRISTGSDSLIDKAIFEDVEKAGTTLLEATDDLKRLERHRKILEEIRKIREEEKKLEEQEEEEEEYVSCKQLI